MNSLTTLLSDVLDHSLPEVNFYSLLPGGGESADVVRLERDLQAMAQMAFAAYEGLAADINRFTYRTHAGILLTIEHDWDGEGQPPQGEAAGLTWGALCTMYLLYQHYRTNAVFSSLCHFPMDEDLFGPYFARGTMAIIGEPEKRLQLAADYGGRKSPAWLREIQRLGALLPVRHWSEL